jgi:xanthine dehydrogenase YagR molybdenum-binding subunit
MQAGASLTSSLGSATVDAAQKLVTKLIEMAVGQNDSPLRGRNAADLVLVDGSFVAGEEKINETITSVLCRAGLKELSSEGHFDPGGIGQVVRATRNVTALRGRAACTVSARFSPR